ncbi:MAG: hypothetical protein DSY90_07170 [Deltaproteobacteria bacterium]|nr:MAG: hypothetical protein DSY90_07170 [Deltaproteobacteria bacterium]
MSETFYPDTLYPLQDKILREIDRLNLDFYLTGGTALSRCYLHHRYSDDLDFFVNDHQKFKQQCRAAVDALKRRWTCEVTTTSDTFVRIFIHAETIYLKIDFVNDVPFHFGSIRQSPIFHRVDNWRNILSNKICAISRAEVKDIADIVFIAKKYPFEWEAILIEAKEKDLWVDPIEICRMINQFSDPQLRTIKWLIDVNIDKVREQISVIHDDIFSGAPNSLVHSDK